MSNKIFGSKQQHSSPPPAFFYNQNNTENIPPSNIVLTSPRKGSMLTSPQKVSTPRKMLANMKAKVLRKPFATEEQDNDATSTSSSGSADEQVPVTPQRRPISHDDEVVSMDEALAKRSPEAIQVSMDDSNHKRTQIEKKILRKSLAEKQEENFDANLEENHKDLPTLSEQLSACVFDKQFSDFVIQCGSSLSTKYYVHRFILASRSSYFRALLSSTALTAGQVPHQQRFTWEREDIHPEIFGKVLEYLYTGQIKLRLDNVLDVFVQSEEFGIPCLKKLCETYLIDHGDYENMAQLLEMSIENKANDLVKHCYQYIDANVKRVLKSESIKNIKTSTMIQIISRDTLQLEALEEVLVFEAVQKWADLRKHLPYEVPNISKIIEHVRYPLMSSEQLANVVEPTQLVPQHPLLFEAYKYHLVKDKNSNQAPRFRVRAGVSSQ